MIEYLKTLTIPWVDVVILLALIVGIFQGRKRGILGEIIDLIRWVAAIAVASLFHVKLGKHLSWMIPGISTLFWNITAYILILLAFTLVAGSLKRAFADRLMNSDIFGGAEYYFGMVAGAIRMACVVVATMALIHAREYTPVEVQARERAQEQNFGSIRFFRLYSLQADIFQSSYVGRAINTHMPVLLIPATSPNDGLDPSKSKLRSTRSIPGLDP